MKKHKSSNENGSYAKRLKPITINFLNQVIENEFWDWVNKKFFKEYNNIQEDLVEAGDSAADKVVLMIDELAEIIEKMGIKEQNEIDLKELKEKYSFNEVYKLKTFAKFIMKKINMTEEG